MVIDKEWILDCLCSYFSWNVCYNEKMTLELDSILQIYFRIRKTFKDAKQARMLKKIKS